MLEKFVNPHVCDQGHIIDPSYMIEVTEMVSNLPEQPLGFF